jgi:hypothetical protein
VATRALAKLRVVADAVEIALVQSA